MELTINKTVGTLGIKEQSLPLDLPVRRQVSSVGAAQAFPSQGHTRDPRSSSGTFHLSRYGLDIVLFRHLAAVTDLFRMARISKHQFGEVDTHGQAKLSKTEEKEYCCTGRRLVAPSLLARGRL